MKILYELQNLAMGGFFARECDYLRSAFASVLATVLENTQQDDTSLRLRLLKRCINNRNLLVEHEDIGSVLMEFETTAWLMANTLMDRWETDRSSLATRVNALNSQVSALRREQTAEEAAHATTKQTLTQTRTQLHTTQKSLKDTKANNTALEEKVKKLEHEKKWLNADAKDLCGIVKDSFVYCTGCKREYRGDDYTMRRESRRMVLECSCGKINVFHSDYLPG